MTGRLAFLNRVRDSEAGFTLIEVVIAVTIITTTMGLLSGAFFQAVSLQRFWISDVSPSRQFNRAASWIGQDALSVEAITFPGGQPGNSATFAWTDFFDNPRSAAYTVSGENLVRTDGVGTAIVVARGVSGVTFSLTNKVLTFTLSIQTYGGQSETRTFNPFLGRLQ